MKHFSAALLVAALLVAALLSGACSGRSRDVSTAPDSDGQWMEGATVVVARDAGAGRETVKLVDPASGFEQVVSDEALTPGAAEVDEEPADEAALAMALAR